jgi:glycosyltransferase involved in cell wall biosynthesis
VSSSPVALVHDYLLVMRGAERTFAAMAECWPQAPIYTLLYDEEGTEGRFAGREIHTSPLQRLGVGQKGFRRLLPLFPYAVRGLAVDRHELVVSSSSAFAHGARAGEDARHVCYCHSPFRYAWFETDRALEEVARPLRPALKAALERVRAADRRASARVSEYVANSAITRERIARYWNRTSSVLHPPVEVDRFHSGRAEDYFLIVTELVRHKRVELALEAALRAGVWVRVVGEGPDRPRLESRFGSTAEFLGRVSDSELVDLHAHARAFLLPNVEEFGIAAVEAQAASRPVVAVAAGGALETVVDGRTGVLVPPDDVRAFAAALGNSDFDGFDRGFIRSHAETFSRAAFQRRLRAVVEDGEKGVPKGQAVAAGVASTLS